MHATDLSAMPPGRTVVDRRAVALVDEWIESLQLCSDEEVGERAR
jgi:hypothetical protein